MKAARLAAQSNVDVLAVAAAAAAVRAHQVANFATAAGSEANAAAVVAGATEEEAARAAQTATRASLAAAMTAIAEAEATTSTALYNEDTTNRHLSFTSSGLPVFSFFFSFHDPLYITSAAGPTSRIHPTACGTSGGGMRQNESIG